MPPTPAESGAKPVPSKKCRCSHEAAAQGTTRRCSDEATAAQGTTRQRNEETAAAAAAAQGAARRRQYLARQLNCRTPECPKKAASGCGGGGRVPVNGDPVDRIVQEGLRAANQPDDDEERWRRRTQTQSNGAVYEPDYYDDQADTRNWLRSRNQPPPPPAPQQTNADRQMVEGSGCAERNTGERRDRRRNGAREERARRARERRRRLEEATRSFERVRRDFRALERSVQRESERQAREERRLRRAREERCRRQQEEEPPRRTRVGFGGRRRLSYRAPPSTDDEDDSRANAPAPRTRKRVPYRAPSKSSCSETSDITFSDRSALFSDRSASDVENRFAPEGSGNDNSRADVRDELRGPPPKDYYKFCY